MADTIELKCEKCGKLVQAPAQAAGRRGKCPYCQASVYIPTPSVEEIPLADEDTALLEHEAALQAERREIERAFRHDDVSVEASRPSAGSGGDVKQAITAYLRAMRDSNFDGAEGAISTLKAKRAEARQIVEQMASDGMPPAEISDVPGPVYQGFLRNLLSQL